MTHNSIDLTGVPGFKNDGPPSRDWPKNHRLRSYAEDVAHVAVTFFIVGLVVGLPVFTVLRLMGVW